MIKNEYLRFLQTLNAEEVSAGVRKVANLVFANFEEVYPLGTTQGKRVKKVASLASNQWANLSDAIAEVTYETGDAGKMFKQLKSIEIGPFRGFAKKESLSLHSLLVLIYGPNGTGKSSFCEALEYGLLGAVEEAQNKRFRNQADYLKNAHTNSFSPPQILGVDHQGNDVVLQPDESLYRFCFVEKNRIDSFSRIAAQAPAKQMELISTLFGLDSFNEFVKNFSPEIDGKYIDLVGEKSVQLNLKRQTLVGHQQQIEQNNTNLKQLDGEEAALAQQYRLGCTYNQMMIELNGDEQNPGLISKLETDLQQPVYAKSGLTQARLAIIRSEINTNLANYNASQQELVNVSQQVSFKQLYESVSKLQANSPDKCPACKTPLTQTALNPYAHADEELKKLHHLAVLQAKSQEYYQSLNQSLAELSQVINVSCDRLTANPLHKFRLASSNQPTIKWFNSMLQPSQGGYTAWQHLEAQVQQLEQSDAAIEQQVQVRTAKQQELNRLRGFAKSITVLQTRRQTAQTTFEKATQAIASFDQENAELISSVEGEKHVVARNKEIVSAYASFVEKLNAYKNALPVKLVADLSEKVTELYNAFNRYDSPNDKLAAVQLPLGQNQRLKISFQPEPDKHFDALHVLSEGHIRCLGLAILLAKNIKTDCPLLIFDDPVNAIDDEHRQAIRETLFKDEFFNAKQIIMACHGEEFFKDTHQTIGSKAAKSAESYIFMPQKGERHVQVLSLQRPKNYVLAASELYAQAEYRDALMSSRRALEHLCEKAWLHYGKHCDNTDKPISVSRRTPHAPWDLRALADNLRSKLNKSKASIPNKSDIVVALDSLLGVGGQDPHWVYLNKGTHEETDRVEFENGTVGTIVSSLDALDNALEV
ncbi:AAA family ATPase [Vibrio cyclitrophicus]